MFIYVVVEYVDDDMVVLDVFMDQNRADKYVELVSKSSKNPLEILRRTITI